MQKKLTITIDEKVYDGLYRVIGPRKISRFIEEMIRPFVVQESLGPSYEAMAKDESREREALEWSEDTLTDVADETR